MLITMNSPDMKAHLSKLATLQMSKPGARKAVTEGQMGEKNHFYGKKHTEETLRKMKEARSKLPWIKCDICGYEGLSSSVAIHKKVHRNKH